MGIAKEVVEAIDRQTVRLYLLEIALEVAAQEAFQSEVIETEMLELELDSLPGVTAEQFEKDWIEDWIEVKIEQAQEVLNG